MSNPDSFSKDLPPQPDKQEWNPNFINDFQLDEKEERVKIRIPEWFIVQLKNKQNNLVKYLLLQ